MEELLKELHDIEGLDPLGIWPLPVGYWGLLAVGILALAYFYSRFRYNRSWKKDTLVKLAALEKNLSEKTAQESVILLSEYLKRIGLHRYPRAECASLIGVEWLKWLSEKDSFDWLKKGELLIEVPYAPDSSEISLEEIQELIQATKKWVKS